MPDDRGQVQVDGGDNDSSSPQVSRPLLLVSVGLVVGLAFGALAGSSRGSREALGEFPLTTLSSATSRDSISDVAELEARIAKLEASLANAEQQMLDAGLDSDPQRFAPRLGCTESFASGFPHDWRQESHFVGPVAFYGFPTSGPKRVFAIVEPRDAVTLAIPRAERGNYALMWGNGEPAVTLTACDRDETFFIGLAVDQTYCAPLDLYFGDRTEPEHIILPLGDVECADGTLPLVKPAPGPIPDVTGSSLREARFLLRLVGLEPKNDDGDLPDNMVWAQEPNDGGVKDPQATVWLRTCQAADAVVATYQSRIATTDIILSEGWMTRSIADDLDSWFFVSAIVSGGPTDGQIATWALPNFGGEADQVNTPSLSFPANEVSERFQFGDRRYTPQDYGYEHWLEIDGAVGSQECVEMATGG